MSPDGLVDVSTPVQRAGEDSVSGPLEMVDRRAGRQDLGESQISDHRRNEDGFHDQIIQVQLDPTEISAANHRVLTDLGLLQFRSA